MPQRHLYFDEADYSRIVAISDIHGDIDLFNQLLAKIALKPTDLLVLVGDYINRGNNSLAALRKVIELAKLSNCVVLSGNHEPFAVYLIKNPQRRAKLVNFLNNWHYPTILHEMATELSAKGVLLATTGEALADQLYQAYRDEFQFMENLDILLEGKSHIFVHAGYEEHYQLPTDYDSYVKYDDYASLATCQAKTVVVGHWPASNLLDDELTNIPYYFAEKNIYFIDGGLNIKASGELNAFFVERTAKGFHYDYLQVNNFKPITIVKPFTYPQEPIVHVKYPDYAVELIEAGTVLSRYRHRQSGAELSVFNCLVESDGRAGLKLKVDYLNVFLEVPVGTTVELVKTFADCSMVKYANHFYWAANQQLSLLLKDAIL